MANEQRTLLCKPVVNFNGKTYHTSVTDGNQVYTVTDRLLHTFSTEGVYILDTVYPGNINADVSHIFIKGKNIERIQISGVGSVGNPIDQQVADYEVQNAQQQGTNFIINDFQNFLFILSRSNTPTDVWNASRIQIRITGSSRRVYEIAALEKVFAFDSQKYYRQLAYNRTHRASVLHEKITGRVKRIDPLNQEPKRWRVRMGIKNRFMNETPIGQDLQNFFDNHPNFAMVPEYSRWADRVFTEATLENPDAQLQFIANNSDSYEMFVTILES